MDLKEALKAHLDKLAKEDELFAKTYAKENKSLDECVKYIYSEVSKKRKNEQCLAVSDDEVYGMAVHYYDEDDIEVGEPSAKVVAKTGLDVPTFGAQTTTTIATPTATVTAKKKGGRKPKSEPKSEGFLPLDIPLF